MIGLGMGLGLGEFRISNAGLYPALDLLFSTNKTLTAYIGSTPSFSRASTGRLTLVNGVLTSAAINAARFTHNFNGSTWNSLGLFAEGQVTNQCLQSEDLSSGSWTLARGTIAANNIAWIDGNTVADRFTEDTATGVHGWVQFALTSTNGSPNTASVYLKAGTRSVFVVRFQDNATGTHGVGAEFNLAAGTISVAALTVGSFTSPSAEIENCGDGWYRCSVTGTPNVTSCSLRVEACQATGTLSGGSFGGGNYAGSTSENWYACGHQFELGARASSYIPTTTAAVTRSADVCQLTGTNFSNLWNASQGTFVFEGICPASGTLGLLSVNDGTANERMELYASGTDPRFIVVDGGVTQADIDAGSITKSTAFKLAARYQANNFAVSVNGAAVVADTVGTLPTVTQMQIGTNQAGNYTNGTISRVRYFNTALTDAQLQALST